MVALCILSGASSLRFVDDSHDVQTSDGSGVLRGLSLGIVEVGGHSHHRVGHLVPQICLRRFLEGGHWREKVKHVSIKAIQSNIW